MVKKRKRKGRKGRLTKRIKRAKKVIGKKVKAIPIIRKKERAVEPALPRVPAAPAPAPAPTPQPIPIPSRAKRLVKIPTGIAGADKILAGGIRCGSASLVYGTPHCGKKPFLMQVAYNAARKGIPVIFILTDHGIEKWKEMMASSGWVIDRLAHLFYFIDCYSRQYGPVEAAPHASYLEVPYSLSSISIECTKACEDVARADWPRPFVVLHSLSSLIESFGESAVFDFLQFFIGKLREESITCAFSLQYGAHDEKITTMILGLMDGIVEMREGQIRFLGYRDAKSRDWFPYSITKRGIKILKAKVKK